MNVPLLILIDFIVVIVSAVAAFFVRDNLSLSMDSIILGSSYLVASMIAGAAFLPIIGISRSVWRFSGFNELLGIIIAAVSIGACAATLCFTYDGMQDVPRSIPVLHIMLLTILAAGLRAIRRLRHARTRSRANPPAPGALQPQPERVLLIGIDAVAELYLRATCEMTRGKVQVVGVLTAARRYRGRTFHGVPVIGELEDIARVLQQMNVHGVEIGRIVISTPACDLPSDIIEVLARIKSNTGISVQYLLESLGFLQPRPVSASASASALHEEATRLPSLKEMLQEARLDRPYWRVKRALDIAGSLSLLIGTAPLMIVVAAIVACDVGSPVVFWQERLGRMGRSLRINKFRTMRPAWNAANERITDSKRTSAIGVLLRRTRLDELPQLYHILVGDMSFIGPRPLLYAEQELAYAARLAVRPGLTGWAQVHGGREVSVSDKVAMDLWYIRNASLFLDIKILMGTVRMLVRGDQPDEEVISMAWREVGVGCGVHL